MSELTRKIVDYSNDGQATEAREAFYAAIHDKVMAHLESQKQSIAQGMLKQEQYTKEEVEHLEEHNKEFAAKHGMSWEPSTYGATMKHPKIPGHIEINRYGEWHHWHGKELHKGGTDKKSLDSYLGGVKHKLGIKD